MGGTGPLLERRRSSGMRRKMANPKSCLRVGIVGGIVTAACCFTPLLVVVLVPLGLSEWLGWLDYVLFPALGLFLALMVYGFYAGQGSASAEPDDDALPGGEP